MSTPARRPVWTGRCQISLLGTIPVLVAIAGCSNVDVRPPSVIVTAPVQVVDPKAEPGPIEGWRWGNGQRDLDESERREARKIDAVRQAIDDGFYAVAQDRLTALVGQGSQHPLIFHLQAQLLWRRGDAEGAIPWCAKAIAASSLWIEPRLLQARCHLVLKQHAQAESIFGDLDHMAPKSPWGPYGMGAVAAMRLDTIRAAKLADEALARDPKHLPSLQLRSSLARMANETDLEQTFLLRLIDEDPLAVEAQIRLGELALAANRRDDARRYFERAHAIDPRPSIAARLAELARAGAPSAPAPKDPATQQ